MKKRITFLKRKDFSEKTKNLVKIIQNNCCADCGIKFPYLQFHHIDGNNFNNLLSNCVSLCPNCHELSQRSMKTIKIRPVTVSKIDPIIFPIFTPLKADIENIDLMKILAKHLKKS